MFIHTHNLAQATGDQHSQWWVWTGNH